MLHPADYESLVDEATKALLQRMVSNAAEAMIRAGVSDAPAVRAEATDALERLRVGARRVREIRSQLLAAMTATSVVSG
jgi:hypothetical protein